MNTNNELRRSEDALWVVPLSLLLGAILLLPYTASAGLRGDSVWVVEKGDSVYSIARSVFPDDAARQRQFRKELVESNASVFNGDANQLSVGQSLTLPAFAVTKAVVPPATQDAVEQAEVKPEPDTMKESSSTEQVMADPEDVIGQVVISVGKMEASNRGAFRELLRHSDILKGDTLSTAEHSYTQIRMKDGALISLRPNTTLKITDYRYDGREDGNERSFMELLSGGFRTITGYIGHRNKRNYRVKTSVATIGIRGTHYGLMVCEGDSCKDENGSLEDGVYGGVVDGSIVVENQSGSSVFNNDQYFHVASIRSSPVEQLVPPPVFHGKAESRAATADGKQAAGVDPQSQGKQGKAALGEQLQRVRGRVAQKLAGSRLGSLVQSYVDDRRPPLVLPDQIGTDALKEIPLVDSAPSGAVALVSFYDIDQVTGTTNSIAAPVIAGFQGNQIILGSKTGAGGAVINNLPIAFTETASGDVHNLILPSGASGISEVNGANVASVGVNWGRWSDNYVFVENGITKPALGDMHYIYSDKVTTPAELSQLSALGGLTATESYSFFGGTTPTNPAGQATSLITISAVSDFVNGKLADYQVVAQDGAANFAMQANNIPFQNMAEFDLNQVNCNAGCTGRASAAFVGGQAQGMMTTYTIQDASGAKGANGSALLIRDSAASGAVMAQ